MMSSKCERKLFLAASKGRNLNGRIRRINFNAHRKVEAATKQYATTSKESVMQNYEPNRKKWLYDMMPEDKKCIYSTRWGSPPDARDQTHLSANFVEISMKWYIYFVVLAQAFLVCSSSSQTAVKNGCPSGCFCVTGQHDGQLMNNLMDDGRVTEAWDRLRRDPHVKVTRTLFCINSNLPAVPRGLTTVSEALFLDENSITSIKSVDFAPSGVFATMMSPTLALMLSKNRISSVQGEAFLSLPHLRLLVLRNNELRDSRWTKSTAFGQLRELDLSLNALQCLCAKDFGILTFLERLDMSGNNIVTVEQDALQNFPNLAHLDLSSNFITQRGLTPSIALTPAVKYLSLADNLLAEFGDVSSSYFFKKFTSLEILDLSQNHVTSGKVLAESFAGLRTVKTLNLSRCGISAFDRGWLGGGIDISLKILDLSHNVLPTIRQRDLSALCPVNDNVSSPRSDLANISKFPIGLAESQSLRPLKRLIALYLNGNLQLHRIQDDAFDYVPNLKFLFLQNCAIRRLNIASARRRFEKEPIASTLPALTHVWIYGNPIACDCYVRFLKEWTVAAIIANQTVSDRYIDASIYTLGFETKFFNVDSSICVTPPSLAGVTVEAAPGQSMTCQEEPYSILIAMLIGPLTFAGSIALTVVCGSLHVSIVRNRKGSALSYYAREELMRNPRIRTRRMNKQHSAFSSIGWNVPHSRDDGPSFSQNVRGGHYTNLVLGSLGIYHQPSSKLDNHPQVQPSAEMTPSHSTTSLRVVEGSPSRQKSAGNRSSVQLDSRDETDNGKVHTRSPGCQDVAFVGQKEPERFKASPRNEKQTSLERSSSGISDSGSSSNASRETRSPMSSNHRAGNEHRQPKDASLAPPNVTRAIPGIASTDVAASEEIFL